MERPEGMQTRCVQTGHRSVEMLFLEFDETPHPTGKRMNLFAKMRVSIFFTMDLHAGLHRAAAFN